MESLPPNAILEFNPNTLENVRKTYNLDLGTMATSVNILEEWISKQNHFVKKDFSREYLEKKIISSKGSVERAKERIEKLCTLKTLLPKYFVDIDLRKDLKSINDLGYVVVLPKMTEDYYRVILIQPSGKNFYSANITEYFRVNINICEYLTAHDYAKGFVIINDYRYLNLVDFITKLDLVEVQQFITLMIEGYGVRLKDIYILTESKVIDILIKTIKPFISPKIAARIHVHSTIEEVYSFLDKKLLPKEYGGEEISIQKLQSDWASLLNSDEHINYMNEMNRACTDETYRQTETFNEMYMGTPGTFRSLIVD